MSDRRERLLQSRVSHDVAGLADLDRQLRRFGARVPIAIERSEGLLVEHLQTAGHAVFPVSPRIAARARERYTTRMGGFLARHHYTGRVPAQILTERMRDNLLAGSPGTTAGKSFSAHAFAEVLKLLNTQLAEYDDAIAAAVAEHPDAPIFASFPGVGPTLTAILLAEIGEDRKRYPSSSALLAEAGLAPVTRASGRSRSVRFRYAANAHLREAAMWWAFNSLKTPPWAAAAFREARDERGQRYHRALRGLAARWTRILWRCWNDHQPYDPAKHTSAATLTPAR